MSTFTQIITNVRRNLNDLGVESYAGIDLTDSVQDAYDDIVVLTQCIIKKTTLNWTADLSYYDLKSLVTDYLATVAIYNNVNSKWLEDDLNVKNLELLSDTWETKKGTPTNWAALNHQYTAIYPKYSETSGTFDLWYWATAPTLVCADTPLIATDFQKLLEHYSTGDLLEQFEEYVSASNFWKPYVENIELYRQRVKNLSKNDLLLRL